MRVPAVRLPAWRPSFDWFDGVNGRAVVLYGLYTLILFAVFLFANFPHGVLVQRALRDVELPGMQLDVGDVRFAWWRGFELQRVRLAPEDPTRPSYLETGSLFVRPGLGGLLHGDLRSVAVSGPLYGGEIDGTFTSGDMQRATLTVDGLQLQRYPLFVELAEGGQVVGALSGVVTVEGRGADIAELRAAGELDLKKAALTEAKWNGITIPPLYFDAITAKFSQQGNRLEIQELKADGRELQVEGSGQVAIRAPLSDSVLNLKVSIAPGPESPEEIKTLLTALLPAPAKGAKPDAPRTLSGTLAKPRLR